MHVHTCNIVDPLPYCKIWRTGFIESCLKYIVCMPCVPQNESVITYDLHMLQVVATYTQQSETSPVKGPPEEMSTSYEEGARSFPHIPEDEPEKDAPGKRYSTRSSSQKQKVGHEHMFHQKVSIYELPQMVGTVCVVL